MMLIVNNFLYKYLISLLCVYYMCRHRAHITRGKTALIPRDDALINIYIFTGIFLVRTDPNVSLKFSIINSMARAH